MTYIIGISIAMITAGFTYAVYKIGYCSGYLDGRIDAFDSCEEIIAKTIRKNED